jgi:endonuclease/exonuclease/phosphatase family metal-dependent hydrolase
VKNAIFYGNRAIFFRAKKEQLLNKLMMLPLLLLLTSLRSSAQERSHYVAAIAFYNFENLFDTLDDKRNFGDDEFLPNGSNRYTSGVYHQKLHNLASVIRQLGTDVTPDGPAIIGTAEIENARVLQDLVRQPEIIDRGYSFVHFEGRDSRGIDVALLYHPGYFKVLHARSVPVPISRGKRKPARTRDILLVHGLLAGDTIHILVNHWPSRRGSEAATAPHRAIAAAINRRIIDSLNAQRPDQRIIVMGDFNDDPSDRSIRKVLGATGEKKDLAHPLLYNPFLRFHKQGTGTTAWNDSWSLFDQVMLSSAFITDSSRSWTYYKAEVFNHDFLRHKFGRYRGYPRRSFENGSWANGYSDHFPALVYLIKEKN